MSTPEHVKLPLAEQRMTIYVVGSVTIEGDRQRAYSTTTLKAAMGGKERKGRSGK
jgi:hypothetical protein